MIFGRDGGPLVIGHRGAPLVAPENTLASFEAALAAGADAVELDVGEGLVVAHSPSELPASPAALDEVLALVRERGAGVLVDLKAHGVEAAVAEAVRRHGLLERALVSATSAAALRRLASHEPRLGRAITYPHDRYRVSRFAWPRRLEACGAAALRAAMPARAALLLRTADARALTLHHALVSPAVVAAVHGRGGVLLAWPVNDAGRVAHLARLGVDAIVTDDPEGAREAVGTLKAP